MLSEATVPETLVAASQGQQTDSTQKTEALSAAAGNDDLGVGDATAEFLKERFEVELEFVQ
ncbi:hypothetical protein GGI22_007396, partial [Coemansia erecta]